MAVELRRIGQGFCGSVWASSTESDAMKREDGGPDRSLFHDYRMHSKILQGLANCQHPICVPACHRYIQADDKVWWDDNISMFPDEHQVSCNLLITDRIPPFTKPVRHSIIEKYCPPNLIPCIETSRPDEDCLIRPYLGRRRRGTQGQKQSRLQAFSLRNYPLHIDQIEELELPGAVYARIMAETLAHLYWVTHVDANDVEFVLAPPRSDKPKTASARTLQSPILGDHCLWLLDFDLCKDMSQDEAGVKQAVAAFYKNDPFYPRPGKNGEVGRQLWEEFKEQFLLSSEAILGNDRSEARLPGLWVAMVEKRQ
ncbi:MAG: hypothetical protein Q9168_006109 [Polycauliona sp. 1 TL-2023]